MAQQQQTASKLGEAFTLPNGSKLKNRIGKAAMEESLCDTRHGPSDTLIALYRQWAQGGAGLLITGNVMIDRKSLTGPSNVIVENASNLADLETWAKAGRSGGGQIWAQISHPGRQVFAAVNEEPVAPSAIAVSIKGAKGMFAVPRALTETDIGDIIERFATTASVFEQAGFNGVQIHGAHGYLLSQFLSPHTNHRTDKWGGSIENRARLLLEVVRAVRKKVSPSFCVGIKLNSADFQRGGYTEEDAEAVIKMLNSEKLDLLEISGGNYEAPAMTGTAGGKSVKETTKAREAYFLTFAKKARSYAKMPLMVTGGFRSFAGMEDALGSGALDVVGMARPFSQDPNVANNLLSGASARIDTRAFKLLVPALNSMAEMSWSKTQMHRIAAGKKPDPFWGPFITLIRSQIQTSKAAKRYRSWLAA
ncbi:MAG: NADH:flavin oxidoreductase/NADH oxidase family protein [Kordiimonadaceae bacterium]|nr:NADH:flavin oxidoreductase/NADH oxidase family protein [Kordiimonadaceae bacterium]